MGASAQLRAPVAAPADLPKARWAARRASCSTSRTWPRACPEPCALSAMDASPAASSVYATTRLSRCGMQRGEQGGHGAPARLALAAEAATVRHPACALCVHPLHFCLAALHAAHTHAHCHEHQHARTCSPPSPARRPGPRSFRVLPMAGARENCRQSQWKKKQEQIAVCAAFKLAFRRVGREGAAGNARGREEAARLGARAWCSALRRSVRL